MRMYLKSHLSIYRGITLFEVLVAIIIFSTGILVVLSAIGSNISWVRVIKTNDIATVLAKEAMEMVYHTRDSNLEKWIVRKCAVLDAASDDYCWQTFYDAWAGTWYFRIDWDINDTQMYAFTPVDPTDLEQTRIYVHTWSVVWSATTSGFRYNHDSTGGELTRYTRYIEFSPLDSHASHDDKVLKVRVFVDVENSWRNKQIMLESVLGDIK